MFLLFCLFFVAGYYYWKNTTVSASIQIDEQALKAFRLEVDSAFAAEKEQRYASYSKTNAIKKEAVTLQKFDPNKDSEHELTQKGVPAYVARGVVKYRNAGGSFNTKRDVAKMYAVNEKVYAKLKDYIDLPDAMAKDKPNWEHSAEEQKEDYKRPSGLNINVLSEAELKSLPGIGDFYAKQLIDYRDKLGGYTAKEQLLEVYKMRPESAQDIADMFEYGKGIKKIDINTASFKQLLAHPYLGFDAVKAVVSYRDQHSGFQNLKEFEALHFFKNKDITKLLPYLDLN